MATVVVNLVLAWTMLLPLGDRYSVDALIARVRTGQPVGERAPPASTGFVTLAALGIALQIAASYTFNTISKTGETWSNGEAIHLVLWQNRIATHWAAWLRLHEPAWLSPLLTKGTLVVEGSAPLLVLSPVAQRYTRTAEFVLTTALHVTIALLMSLGPFSYAMIALNMLLLPKEAMDWVERRLSGGRLSRAAAFALDRAAHLWGRFGGEARPVRRPSLVLSRARLVARETAIGFFLLAFVVQLSNDNSAIPMRFHIRRSDFLAAVIDYPHLFQRWNMFAPDAPRTDGTLVVDGVTARQEHIDPFTGKAPDLDAPLHGPYYIDWLHCDYFNAIADAAGYRGELKTYLFNWQEITGRPPSDRLVDVTVYWVEADAPPPGETKPRNVDRRVLFRGRASEL
jgi:hypothetical protein